MKWITRERPKIDRIACPWLIRRFIDEQAEFLYVPFDQVLPLAAKLEAIPFDVPDVEFGHHGDECTFDALVKKYDIRDKAVKTIALIVRGADTDRHELAPQAAGLWAIFAGLSYNIKNDQELLQTGMIIYDALYSWACHLQHEKHTRQPAEAILLSVYKSFLQEKPTGRKPPAWVKDLKQMIQDQIDLSMHLSLGELSHELQVHPAYLSREFSKHFDGLSFGEYVRKMRIDKAISLMENASYSLTEIAYLTGFSDQSHFTRIFKKTTGKSPSVFRKNLPEK